MRNVIGYDSIFVSLNAHSYNYTFGLSDKKQNTLNFISIGNFLVFFFSSTVSFVMIRSSCGNNISHPRNGVLDDILSHTHTLFFSLRSVFFTLFFAFVDSTKSQRNELYGSPLVDQHHLNIYRSNSFRSLILSFDTLNEMNRIENTHTLVYTASKRPNGALDVFSTKFYDCFDGIVLAVCCIEQVEMASRRQQLQFVVSMQLLSKPFECFFAHTF